MSVIPLHIQRKFEQRWAARFLAPAASAVPKSSQLKGAPLPRPVKAKEKPAELSKRAR
jgi:hypothetical protein